MISSIIINRKNFEAIGFESMVEQATNRCNEIEQAGHVVLGVSYTENAAVVTYREYIDCYSEQD